MRFPFFLLIGLSLVLSACGGGASGGPKNDTKASIKDCFDKSGQVRNINIIDSPAGVPSDTVRNPLNVLLIELGTSPGGDPENRVLIDVESDAASGDSVERDFNGSNAGAAEVDRKGNVVLGWIKKPTDSEKATIGTCV
jgi:hypothetical protein